MTKTPPLDKHWYEASDLTIFDAAFWMVMGDDPRRHEERYEKDSDYAEEFDREPLWVSMIDDKCDVIISAIRAQVIPMTLEVNLTGQRIGEFHLPALRIDATHSRIGKSAWIDWCRQNGYSELADRFLPRKGAMQGEATTSLPENETNGCDSQEVRAEEKSSVSLNRTSAQPTGIDRRGILAVEWPLLGKFNQDSLSEALSNVPKWLEHARVSRGAPGKGSALWNPALVAVCLVEKSHANKKALTTHIRNHFSEWLVEWEKMQEHL